MRLGELLAAAVVLQLAFVDDANAYLDPGTGSFLFQTLIATVVGAGFTIKLYWQRIKRAFGRKPADDAPATRDKEAGGGD